jgi:hypothetical protein
MENPLMLFPAITGFLKNNLGKRREKKDDQSETIDGNHFYLQA